MSKKTNIRNLIISIILCTVFTFGSSAKVYADNPENASRYLDVYYFHDNPCEACHEDTKFISKFNSLIGDGSKGVNFNIYVEDIFKQSSGDLFNDLCDKFNIPQNKRKVPAIFIGGSLLQGETEIDQTMKSCFLEEKAAFLKTYPEATVSEYSTDKAVQAAHKAEVSTEAGFVDELRRLSGTDTNIVFFYVTACGDCEEVKTVLGKLNTSYLLGSKGKAVSSKVNIKSYNAGEMENHNLSKLYFKAYHVPEKDQLVPLIFMGDKYFSGGKTSLKELETAIKNGEGTKTLLKVNESTVSNDLEGLNGYSYTGIFLTGIVNGLNPCSLSMLLFFFSLLLARSINVLKFGVSFILGKFLTYHALGTIAYNLFLYMDDSWLQGFQRIVKYLLLAAIVVFAAMNFHDCFTAKKEHYGDIRLQLPARLRRINHKWIHKLTEYDNTKFLLLMCFTLGAIISIGELLCTGQIYLATIIFVLKSSRTLELQAVSSFLIYVSAMMIPLIIITLVIHKGKELFVLSETIRTHLPLIKLINAVIFLLFAAAMFILF